MSKQREHRFPDLKTARKRYPHGTRARYTLAKCRCRRCKNAAAQYELARYAAHRPVYRVRHIQGGYWHVRDIATETTVFLTRDRTAAYEVRDLFNSREPVLSPNVLIDATPVREHLAALAQAGIGRRTIATHARLAESVIVNLREGRIKRTRRATAERILNVDTTARPNHQHVDAATFWTMVDRLVALGLEPTWIATLVGRSPHNIQKRYQLVTLGQARAMYALYHQLRERIPQLRFIES